MVALHQLVIILAVAIVWLAVHTLNRTLFDFSYLNPHIAAIFLPAGVRVIAVFLFDWVGAMGLFLGYFVVIYYLFHGDLFDALGLALLSGFAPYLGYRTWLKVTNTTPHNLQAITLKEILLLTSICSIFNSICREIFFALADKPHGFIEFLNILVGNFIGSLVLFYILVAIARITKFIIKKA